MTDTLFVAWQDEESRRWITVARVTRGSDGYEFVFTRGARHLKSLPETLFRIKTGLRYKSAFLLPIFMNRVPAKSRADFSRLARWVNVSEDADDFELIARFGLIPGTDSMMIYPPPIIRGEEYKLDFFVHGIRHMHKDVEDWCAKISQSATLRPMLDVQNTADPNAVALRPEDGKLILGYVPTFYAGDLHNILMEQQWDSNARIFVLRRNTDAPPQLRLLCRFTSRVPPNFKSMQLDDQIPLVTELA